MVKHIVFFKLKENTEQNNKEFIDVLLSMRGKVPTAKQIEAHPNFVASDRAYDIALEVIVESETALAEYQKDEYHHGVVVPYVLEKSDSIVAVDYHM